MGSCDESVTLMHVSVYLCLAKTHTCLTQVLTLVPLHGSTEKGLSLCVPTVDTAYGADVIVISLVLCSYIPLPVVKSEIGESGSSKTQVKE